MSRIFGYEALNDSIPGSLAEERESFQQWCDSQQRWEKFPDHEHRRLD